MTRSSVEPKTRKYVKWYEFLSFARYQSDKYGTELLDTATKTGLYALKSASKKRVDRVAEATGAFIGNKIVDKIVKPKPVTSIKNMVHYKISKTLNDLIVLILWQIMDWSKWLVRQSIFCQQIEGLKILS